MSEFDLSSTWAMGVEIWGKGGWAMYPLAFSAFILYYKAAQVRLMFTTKDFTLRSWRRRLRAKGPERYAAMSNDERDAEVGRLYLLSRGLRYPSDADFRDTEKAFGELRANEFPELDRNMKFMKAAMASAPLWGLLGTVSGMLTTFASLASGGGGDQAASNIAGGISEALITTQTGLMIALPGYFFMYYLNRRRGEYESFVAHLETNCSQKTLRMSREGRVAA